MSPTESVQAPRHSPRGLQTRKPFVGRITPSMDQKELQSMPRERCRRNKRPPKGFVVPGKKAADKLLREDCVESIPKLGCIDQSFLSEATQGQTEQCMTKIGTDCVKGRTACPQKWEDVKNDDQGEDWKEWKYWIKTPQEQKYWTHCVSNIEHGMQLKMTFNHAKDDSALPTDLTTQGAGDVQFAFEQNYGTHFVLSGVVVGCKVTFDLRSDYAKDVSALPTDSTTPGAGDDKFAFKQQYGTHFASFVVVGGWAWHNALPLFDSFDAERLWLTKLSEANEPDLACNIASLKEALSYKPVTSRLDEKLGEYVLKDRQEDVSREDLVKESSENGQSAAVDDSEADSGKQQVNLEKVTYKQAPPTLEDEIEEIVLEERQEEVCMEDFVKGCSENSQSNAPDDSDTDSGKQQVDLPVICSKKPRKIAEGLSPWLQKGIDYFKKRGTRKSCESEIELVCVPCMAEWPKVNHTKQIVKNTFLDFAPEVPRARVSKSTEPRVRCLKICPGDCNPCANIFSRGSCKQKGCNRCHKHKRGGPGRPLPDKRKDRRMAAAEAAEQESPD